MQRVLEDNDDQNLRVFVVWISAIRSDHYEASLESRKLISDPRARHYWDGSRALGYALAPVLSTRMAFAWDVYLAYGANSEWLADPPKPVDWLHQKQSEPPERYLSPGKLETLLSGQPLRSYELE